MSPSIPTNFNDTAGLEDYVKDLGVAAGVGFVVPALVLSMVLVFVFVKYCGGQGKTRVKFESSHRTGLVIASLVITLICIATCAVGWSYNNKIHSSVSSGVVTLQGVLDESENLMLSVNSSVGDLKTDLLNEILVKSAPVVGNISSLFIPLNNILDIVDSAGGILDNLAQLTQVIINNITVVKVDLTALSLIASQSGGVITGVPSPNEIPNVDPSYSNSLNNSQASLQAVIRNIHNLTNDVNNTVNAVNTTVTSKLTQLTSNYDNNANTVLSYAADFQTKIKSSNSSYQGVSLKIIHYSQVRKTLVAAILVLPLIISGLALLAVLFKIKLIIKLAAAFCFIFMFWYFLAAGINFVAYYTIEQVCDKQDAIVTNTIAIANQEITIPGTNVTVRVSDKVSLMLHCSGNDTLLEIFEFDFLIDDLTGEITSQIQSLIGQTNELNQTSEYDQGLNNLASMENTTVNLDFLQNSSLPTVHQELNNITSQVNNTINNPAYFASLAAVNNITNNLMLTNGTEIHMYYDSNNITTLNCTVDPYGPNLNANQRQDLCNKSTIAIALTKVRDETIAKSGSVYGNVTDINNRLYGFEASLPQIEGYQNETRLFAAEIRSNLSSAYSETAAIIVYVQNSAQAVLSLITSGTASIIQDTQCAYLGSAYVNLTNDVCQNVRYSLRVITVMMIIGGCMLFALAIVAVVSAYRLERDYPNQE